MFTANRDLSIVLAVALAVVSLGVVLGAQASRPLDAGDTTVSAATTVPAATDRDAMSIETSPGGRYRIAPTDVLELQFPYVPEFNQTVAVQPDGYISLKAVNEVLAMGRTVSELRAALVEQYEQVLRDPVVTIILKDFEKPYVMVAGEVAHPGKYELRGATTLTQALILAGGHTPSAKHSQVVLFRAFMNEWLEVKQLDVKEMYASRNLSEDPVLRNGDTVLVPKSAMAKIAPFIPRPSIGFYLNPFQP